MEVMWGKISMVHVGQYICYSDLEACGNAWWFQDVDTGSTEHVASISGSWQCLWKAQELLMYAVSTIFYFMLHSVFQELLHQVR